MQTLGTFSFIPNERKNPACIPPNNQEDVLSQNRKNSNYSYLDRGNRPDVQYKTLLRFFRKLIKREYALYVDQGDIPGNPLLRMASEMLVDSQDAIDGVDPKTIAAYFKQFLPPSKVTGPRVTNRVRKSYQLLMKVLAKFSNQGMQKLQQDAVFQAVLTLFLKSGRLEKHGMADTRLQNELTIYLSLTNHIIANPWN